MLNVTDSLKKCPFKATKTKREVIEDSFVANGKKYDFIINPNNMDIFESNEFPGDDYLRQGPDLIPNISPAGGAPRKRYLCLQPTMACNLNCTYCFTQYYKDKKATFMSWSTAKKAIDMFIPSSLNKEDQFKIGFFGGEPTCAYTIVRDIISYSLGKISNQSMQSFHMTTNGTLIDDKWIDLFKRSRWSFIVSIDGPEELHNKTRITHDGEGSHAQAIEGLKRLSEVSKAITIRGTFVPDKDMKYLDRVKYANDLIKQGYGNWVSVEPVQMSESQCLARPDAPETFEETSVEDLEQEFFKVAEWYVQEMIADRKPILHFIDKLITRLLYKTPSTSECGAGKGYYTVDWKGDVFACHRLNGTKIGDVWNGIDERLRTKWWDNQIYTRENCMSCNFRFFCGGGCRQNSTFNIGDIRVPNPTECRIKEAMVRMNLYIMARMRELGKYQLLLDTFKDPYAKDRGEIVKKSVCNCGNCS